jgi:glycosyltransferase involved in cell wall biosynthesis
MGLVILDPNLIGEGGHHLGWDLAIAREARRRGQEVRILANRRFGERRIEDIPVLPVFREHCYARLHPDDPVAGRFDDFRVLNDTLAEDLGMLPRAWLGATDCAVATTVNEMHLLGYAAWIKALGPRDAPLLVLHLLLPSGIAMAGMGRASVEDEQQALFYRLGFRMAEAPGAAVHLFAAGPQYAAEFGWLRGAPVPAFPLPCSPSPSGRRGPSPMALLHVGDVKPEKGTHLVPRLAELVGTALPDWRLVAHANPSATSREALAVAEQLRSAARKVPQLDVRLGRLEERAYLDLLDAADLMVLPYQPAAYRRKSSGVLWEAVALGTPLVVPAETWLHREAEHWHAGHVAAPGQDVTAIAQAVTRAAQELQDLRGRSAAASHEFRLKNGPVALLDQIGRIWTSRLLAASLRPEPREIEIDLAQPMPDGWHAAERQPGRVIRWTRREARIVFDWPFEAPWELEIVVASWLAREQVDRIMLRQGREALAVHVVDQGLESVLLRFLGRGRGKATPRAELVLSVPFTRRAAGDARDLGVMVSGLRVRPGGSQEQTRIVQPALTIRAKALADGSLPLRGVLSGEVSGEFTIPKRFSFAVDGASPEEARGLTLFVNGIRAGLEMTPQSGRWLGQATVPVEALLQGGLVAAWDLVAPSGAVLRLSDLAVADVGDRPD